MLYGFWLPVLYGAGVARMPQRRVKIARPHPEIRRDGGKDCPFAEKLFMNRELIINVTPTEISIALAEDKVLVELSKEQCQTGFSVGDIYLGKVRKIMPGLNAAFVNIGHEKDAFIHYLDLGPQFLSLKKLVAAQQPGKRGMRLEGMKLEPALEKTGKIGSYLEVGQTLMVQVAKEAISTKGPRLTADISLAGRNVVLVPFSSKVFISQKIRSAEEKKRLKKIAQGVLPKNFGVIIRTAAMNASDADVEHDIQSLVDKWHTALRNVRKSTAPALLLSELNRANTIIRDSLNSSFSQITVNDEAMYAEIRNYKLEIPLRRKEVTMRCLPHHRAYGGDERHRCQFGQPDQGRRRSGTDGDGCQPCRRA